MRVDFETPLEIVAAAHRFATIALDPCTAPNNPTGAVQWIAPPGDGLGEDWVERARNESGAPHVWLAPPVSGIDLWVGKLIRCYREIAHVTLFAPSYTADGWYRAVVRHADAIVYVAERQQYRVQCETCVAAGVHGVYATRSIRGESGQQRQVYVCPGHVPLDADAERIRRAPHGSLLAYFGCVTPRWREIFEPLGDYRPLRESKMRDNPLQARLGV